MSIFDAVDRQHQAKLERALADARRPYVLAQKANLARIAELIEDAEQKRAEHEQGGDGKTWLFYDGVVTGLRRAVMVMEGRG